MLVKEFSATSFPFSLRDGKIAVRKQDRVPVAPDFEPFVSNEQVSVFRPGLKYPINFYCVTHVRGENAPKENQESPCLRVVAISDGKKTSYNWFGKKVRAHYVANVPSRSFEEAWLNLFKAVIMDDTKVGIQFYDLAKHFFMEYFKTIDKDEDFVFDVTLSGRWNNQFLNVEFSRMPLQAHSSVMVNINDTGDRIVSMHTHPIVEALGV